MLPTNDRSIQAEAFPLQFTFCPLDLPLTVTQFVRPQSHYALQLSLAYPMSAKTPRM